jgi:hypothetical protein
MALGYYLGVINSGFINAYILDLALVGGEWLSSCQFILPSGKDPQVPIG